MFYYIKQLLNINKHVIYAQSCPCIVTIILLRVKDSWRFFNKVSFQISDNSKFWVGGEFLKWV